MTANSSDLLNRPHEMRDLTRKLVVLAAVVILCGMLAIGLWVKHEIERVVVNNAGAVTALYVDAMIAPALQDAHLLTGLGPDGQSRLDEILSRGALQEEIYRFKLWAVDGTIIYSDDVALVGRRLRIGTGLGAALEGRVHASITRATHDRDGDSIPENLRLLEVYSPVLSAADGAVIAVAEFYTPVDTLEGDLAAVARKVWLVVGSVSLLMFGGLFALFLSGHRTISRQRRALDEKIAHLAALLSHNSELASRVAEANRRVASAQEDYLRRISSELHDGPAQHLAFAALQLDGPGEARHLQARSAVREALREIRNICQGFALPELDRMSVLDIARRLAADYDAKSGLRSSLLTQGPMPDLPLEAKTCLYRFLQEALNNCRRHAPVVAAEIVLRHEGDSLLVRVRDDGPGFDVNKTPEACLGLRGLRERATAIRARFELLAQPGEGVEISLWLPLNCDEMAP